jgi:hypothetical protein
MREYLPPIKTEAEGYILECLSRCKNNFAILLQLLEGLFLRISHEIQKMEKTRVTVTPAWSYLPSVHWLLAHFL